MTQFVLPLTCVAKETTYAFLLKCPESSYSYAGATFWLSKKQAQKMTYGHLSYLQVYFPSGGGVELSRFFFSKKQQRETVMVSWTDVASMFVLLHDQMRLRLEMEQRNQAADRIFESQYAGETSYKFPYY